MRLLILLGVSVLLALQACDSVGSRGDRIDPDVEQAKAAIEKTRNAYVEAWRAADAGAIARLYADDAMVLYPGQPAVAGREEILAYFGDFFGQFSQEQFELTSAEVVVAGSWAFDRGGFRWRGRPQAGGDALEDQGKYLVILRQQADGSWKIFRDMDNSDKPLTQSTRGTG